MSRPSSEPRPSSVCLVVGSYVFVGGLTSLLGWTSNQPSLTDWTGSGISIQPNATVCAIATGAGLVLLWLRQRALAGVLGGIAALIALATIFEYVTGVDLGIDTRLMFGHEWGRRGVLFPGRMGPPGCASWTLIGIALVLASTGKAAARRIVPMLAGAVCGLSTLSLIGYLFEADPFHTLPQWTVIAFQTSTFVFSMGLGLIAAIPEYGPAAMLKRDDAAGVMMRRALIPILAVPLLLGWIRLVGEQAGLYDSAFGTAARTLVEIILLSIVVWWTLHAIARLEDSRKADRLAVAVRDRLLSAVTEHAAVGLAIVDPEGRYLYANRQYASIIGLPAPQIVGRNIEESLRAVYLAQIDLRLRRAFAGERVQFELTLTRHGVAGRADRLFDVIYEPQGGGGGVESVVMAITDITARKATEQSLREQAHLLELAHDAIMLLEMDGTIVSWNHGAVETYGFTARESVGRIAHQLLHTEFPQPWSEIYEIAERHGRWEGELGHTTKDGRRIVVASRWALQPAADGRPARVMEINRDVTHRKRIEAALHAKEAELNLITTTTPVILTRCSRDLHYLFVNDAAAALFGLSPSQMIGQPLAGIMGEEALARIRPAIERALRGETVDFEAEISYPQAGLRWIRANYMPEVSAEGEVVGWIASATDITERRRVEEKLRESERTERLLSEIGALAAKLGVPEGVQVDDVIESICEHVASEIGVSRCGFGHVDLGDGHVTVDAESRGQAPSLKGSYAVSEYAPHLLADGVAGRITILEDIASDPRTTERYAEIYEPIGVRSSVNIPLLRDGRWVAHFWVSSDQPRHWTESEVERIRRTAERIWLVVEQARVSMDLRDSEVRLARELAAAQQLQEVSSQLIQDAELEVQLLKILRASAAITGTHRGNIQLVDPATGELRIIVHQGLSPRFVEHFAERGWDGGCDAAKEGGKRVIVEDLATTPEELKTEDYEVLVAEGVRGFQSTPIIGRDGRVIGMLNDHFSKVHRCTESELRYIDLLTRMAADLIERKQVEEALREADRRKDEFLATLAHELRNPLAPIRNAVHLIRTQAIQDSEGRLAHDIIDRQLQHLVRLVDDLLEVSRITRGRIELQKQRVDLASILASAVETVHDRIEASSLQLAVTLPRDPIALEADPVRLTQVFANLFNNACKYTPTGGGIDVTVRREGPQVSVSVRDSGAGIPPQMLDSVFNLFTQVDRSLERSTGGLGIGLHLVRRLIELHGGTVTAHSEGENMGSEFIVCLPAPVTLDLPETPVGGDGVGPRSPLHRRILLVDDNHDSVESLALLLGHQGHETEVAYDGQEAVDKARTWRPDVILLDIGLPVMNGYDACRAIRRTTSAKDLRIFALSGWGQEQDRAMAREAGFDEHLVKPVNIGVLLKLLDEPEPAEA